MGTEFQNKCEECLNCSNIDEIEFKKNNSNNNKKLKSARNILRKNNDNDLTFLDNNTEKSVLIITNPKLYEKMLKGEKLHLILEPLTSFSNNNLIIIIQKLFSEIEQIKKDEKNSVCIFYEKIYNDIINKGIIDNMIKIDLGFYTKVKFNLIYVIEIITEIYHYFIYHVSDGLSPYNLHYWDFVKDTVNYMKEKIKDLNDTLEETYNFIYENKLKNPNHMVNIHITTNDFNLQMDQE